MHIYDILHKFQVETYKPIATPFHASIHYTKDMMPATYEEQGTMALVPYANAIGCFMYFTTYTKLDITFMVNHLAQIMFNFYLVHWFVVKCLLHYIQATQHMNIQYFALSITS
jgi:peptidoglycan/LPS O-acetylase OafA/YrhL